MYAGYMLFTSTALAVPAAGRGLCNQTMGWRKEHIPDLGMLSILFFFPPMMQEHAT